MTGVDLSRPFRGRKLPERDYAWGGYSDSFFIRSRRWMLWGYNRPGNFKLFDLRRDPGMNHNVAAPQPGEGRRAARQGASTAPAGGCPGTAGPTSRRAG